MQEGGQGQPLHGIPLRVGAGQQAGGVCHLHEGLVLDGLGGGDWVGVRKLQGPCPRVDGVGCESGGGAA